MKQSADSECADTAPGQRMERHLSRLKQPLYRLPLQANHVPSCESRRARAICPANRVRAARASSAPSLPGGFSEVAFLGTNQQRAYLAAWRGMAG
jgi:hypothetical protein